jgi:hypothetical protein
MARREPAIPLPHDSDQATWIDEALEAICRSLLERPLDCRGPFVISNRELQSPDKVRSRRRLRVAT